MQHRLAAFAVGESSHLEPVILHAGEHSPGVGGYAQTVHMPTAQELLEFESTHPQRRRGNGWKEEAIRTRFGIPPARYFQLLHRAAVSVEGQQQDPVTARIVRDRVNA